MMNLWVEREENTHDRTEEGIMRGVTKSFALFMG